ncbi:MAG: amino acid permease [Alphaproteobacteria bacterium]|nr:MAG: amino acid permease [Alphaproteobacteria bacterium]
MDIFSDLSIVRVATYAFAAFLIVGFLVWSHRFWSTKFVLEGIHRKKLPAPEELGGPKLLSVLTAWDLTLLGVGAIIGTGIFVLTGLAAATQAGPAVVLSFVVSGFACAFAALAYAELSASVGGCGSAYGYSYAAFGEFIAWIIGWDLVLEYGVSVAAVANGWSGYLYRGLHAMNINVPEVLTRGPFAVDNMTGAATPGFVNIAAVLIILVLMGLLIMGVKQSARFNNIMVIVKLVTIGIFLTVAMGHVDSANWQDFMPFGWFHIAENGKPVGVLAGAALVFFAYVGFDAVSTAVEEAKDPKRDVPIGILASLGICTVIYIIVSAVLTGIVSYKTLGTSSPAADALEAIGMKVAAATVSTGVVMGLTAVMLVLYYGLTRIILSMSRDGLLPKMLGEVSPKTHTPVKTTVICGVVMAVMAGFIPLGALAELVNIGTLAAFVLVCIGVIVLRVTQPKMKRPFETPGGLAVPAIGAVSCAALMYFLPGITLLRFVVWLLVGLIIYFEYGVRHSNLAPKKK